MEAKEIINLLIQAAIAIGTMLVAFLAIYSEKIKRWLYRPKLDAFASSDQPYMQVIKNELTDSFDESAQPELKITATIRIKVVNGGLSTALATQGFIEAIYQKRPNNTYYRIKTIPATPLPWHNSTETYSIIPHIPCYLELGVVQTNEKIVQFGFADKSATQSEYQLFVPVEDYQDKGKYIRLGKGTFLIPVNIYSEYLLKPNVFYFEVFWNGEDPTKVDQSNFYFKKVDPSQLPNEIKDDLKGK